MIEKVFRIEISAGVERVWDEITSRTSPHHAMFGTYLRGELREGELFTYTSGSGKHTFVLGKILEVDRPHRLVHTFRFSMLDDEPTLVVWELAEKRGITEVTVTHSRFDGQTKTYKSVETSWVQILALYKTIIETGTVPLVARMKNAVMMSMCFMLPKSARTEVATSKPLDAPAQR